MAEIVESKTGKLNAMRLIFKKEKLSKTDVEKRLAIPTDSLKDLPEFRGKHFLDLKVQYKDFEEPVVFRCSKRKKGLYAKPVFSKGWLQFVRRNDIRIGDSISFLQNDTAEFKIQLQRKIILLGQAIWSPLP